MPKPLELTSPKFKNGTPIPIAYTGEGDDKAPPLHWENLPAGAKSLALIVEDPDAPDPANPQRTFCHWVVYNLPVNAQNLPDGATLDVLPEGVKLGRNDFGRQDYGGPMPPIGNHRYYFKLYALDTVLPDLGQPTRTALLEAMEGHIVGETQLMGTYEKAHRRKH